MGVTWDGLDMNSEAAASTYQEHTLCCRRSVAVLERLSPCCGKGCRSCLVFQSVWFFAFPNPSVCFLSDFRSIGGLLSQYRIQKINYFWGASDRFQPLAS